MPPPPSLPSPTAHTSTRIDARLLLALAALLIFNSHLESFYPLPWLAGDGLLGNSIFLLMSGYGIQSSLSGRAQRFGQYISRRFWRIYPAVAIVALCIEMPTWSRTELHSPLHWLSRFVWPTSHTYVACIVPFYLALFWLARTRSSRLLWITFTAALAIFLVGSLIAGITPRYIDVPRPAYLYWCFNSSAFVTGALFAKHRIAARLSWPGFLIVVLCGLTYVGVKFASIRAHWVTNASPIISGLALLTSVVMFIWLTHPTLPQRLCRLLLLGPALTVFSLLTFEIYIVHETLLEHAFFHQFRFPLNIFVLLAITLVIAAAIHVFVNWLRRRFEPNPEPPKKPANDPVPEDPRETVPRSTVAP